MFGITQGSLHENAPPKMSRGDDWYRPANIYNTYDLKGDVPVFKLPGVKSERTKTLSNHQYNPYIGDCASYKELPASKRASDYETHSLHGPSGDQRYAMPSFTAPTSEILAKHSKNQYDRLKKS